MFSKIFSKENLFFVLVILAVVGATYSNLEESYKKSRDITRKNDLGDIEKRLGDFKEKIGYYPKATEDGKILGCDGVKNLSGEWIFKPCAWGNNPENSPFFPRTGEDPYNLDGVTYAYRSNGVDYQLFAYLERPADPEYDSLVVKRNIQCGSVICNTGRTNHISFPASSPLPLP